MCGCLVRGFYAFPAIIQFRDVDVLLLLLYVGAWQFVINGKILLKDGGESE
jgi:hypothetical protein